MYNITNFDIEEAIKDCNSAMTVKGQIIGYAMAKCGKDIENRNRKIKDGWYALHVGGSKSLTPKHLVIYSLIIDKYNNDDLPPLSSIIGCFKIEGYVKESNSKWFFGPVGSKIVKYIHFKEPIKNLPGHQSITYKLDTIDKKLLKRKEFSGEKTREKIIKELRRLISK